MTDWPGTPDLPARDLVLANLAQRGRGREHAIVQTDLARELGWTTRAVQAAIETMRRDGVPVCTGPAGVWLTDSPDELRAQYRSLRRRAIHQMANLRRMLRTAEAMERPLVMPWGREDAA